VNVADFLDTQGWLDQGTGPKHMRLQRRIQEGIETQILLPS
jgi:hypothetical protein